MEQIIITQASERTLSYSKVKLQHVVNGPRFGDFVETKSKILSAKKKVEFQQETVDILRHCNPHDAVSAPETTHLVVGYVQSGKTMSFTGVTALALDNGYRVIVYLAGTKNNLLEQTADRLKKDLVKAIPGNSNYFKIRSNPTLANKEDIIGPLKLSTKPIVLIPILKHYDHINKIKQIFECPEFKAIMSNETVVIIDDEADQASLNSFARKNSSHPNQEDEVSRTYDSILQLRACLPGNTYIQYTATPQANILISMSDLLSPQSHTLLQPGEGYIGGKLFFGRGVNKELYNGQLIVEIPENEVFHKKLNPLKSMPKSLKEALMMHILAVAIVVKWPSRPKVQFLSMMVHPDNTKDWNKKFKNWIDNQLKHWSIALDKPDGCDDKINLYESFEKIFPQAIKLYAPDERPLFEEIKPKIKDIINDKKVYLVNTDKDAETSIEWMDFPMHILVGAEMLNRGFTVENLATTYMPRYTTGAANADTIQQRCRFFGYKGDYIKSCRVYLPLISIENYWNYIDHEEELRSLLSSCDTLPEVERKMLLSPRLKPTRANVLPKTIVNKRLNGLHEMSAYCGKALVENNTKIVEQFVDKHAGDFECTKPFDTVFRNHRKVRVTVDEAISFLSDFRFGNCDDAIRKSDTIRYLRYLSEKETEKVGTVEFCQIAYNASGKERELKDDGGKVKVTTNIFTGPSSATDSTDYPGDRAFVADDVITIQIHHIKFLHMPVSFPSDGYTIAINYPAKLAANYCSDSGVDYSDWEED